MFGLRLAAYRTPRSASSPAARAADIHAAFADPDIKAVIASIGGEDELKVLAHLDPDVLAAAPKPFFLSDTDPADRGDLLSPRGMERGRSRLDSEGTHPRLEGES